MFLLYKIAGSLIAPPGLFVVLLFVLSAAAAEKFRKGLSIALLIFAAVVYTMSIPAGARLITGGLEDIYERSVAPDGERAAIIALGGGSSYDKKGSAVMPSPVALQRVVEAVRLASSRSGESVLIMSGGNVFGDVDRPEAFAMADAATLIGYKGHLVAEGGSRTTAENMRRCAELLRQFGIEKAVIVTTAYHMPRAMQLAARRMPGIKLYPYPSGRLSDPLIRGASSFLPEAGSFYVSCLGAKERIGLMANRILK